MREVISYEVIAQFTSSVVNAFNKYTLRPTPYWYKSRLEESVAGGEIITYVEQVIYIVPVIVVATP